MSTNFMILIQLNESHQGFIFVVTQICMTHSKDTATIEWDNLVHCQGMDLDPKKIKFCTDYFYSIVIHT